ncbi:MAG: 23S rRNA (uracil(1939)-C(5))-methyltransferase RlmD [Elusimicrobia bacterium]|nr:23S rRNA (uracil(1939)-C(5))-methyltransferase RlmD [Candidatus Obscuribacterium magneticum]
MTDAVINIDRLAPEGDGIGREEPGKADRQMIAFVPYSLPGETLRCRLFDQRKTYGRWLPLELRRPSPSRVEPRCPLHFQPGRKSLWCGGCDWQHMDVPSQRKFKRDLLLDCLRRIGGFSDVNISETVESPQEWRYRNKVQVPFGRSGRDLVAGFYAPESHRIVEFEDCVVQPESSVRIVLTVKSLAKKYKWAPYEEDRHRGWLRHLLIRTNRAGEALVTFVTSSADFPAQKRALEELRKAHPKIIGLHQNVQSSRSHVILGPRWVRLWGKDKIQEEMSGLKIGFRPGSFFQVNTGAAEKLYLKALEEARLDKSMTVLDFYCGVGALTLLAAREAGSAIGVESVAEAVRDARENSQANGIGNAQFMALPVEDLFNGTSSLLEKLDPEKLVVILDPPRSGCGEGVTGGLVKLKPRRIVYVSCHPATLARDLKILGQAYQVIRITPVDLFPQTSHVEAVAGLELK